MFAYIELLVLFSLENVWDMVMICLNSFSLALMKVLEAYSVQLPDID